MAAVRQGRHVRFRADADIRALLNLADEFRGRNDDQGKTRGPCLGRRAPLVAPGRAGEVSPCIIHREP